MDCEICNSDILKNEESEQERICIFCNEELKNEIQ